jgi:hypothetical protein
VNVAPPGAVRTSTRRRSTSPAKAPSAIGVYGNRFVLARARRNPTPIPRKLARRIRFVKYER